MILLKQVKKILKPKGKIFIFEPLVRELHQIPEDYSRFTPYGLNNNLKKLNFKDGSVAFLEDHLHVFFIIGIKHFNIYPLIKEEII